MYLKSVTICDDLRFLCNGLQQAGMLGGHAIRLPISKTYLQLRLPTSYNSAVLPRADETSRTNKGLDVASLSEGV